MKTKSCEHCGHPSRDALRRCDICHGGMCPRCTDTHDETDRCPIDVEGEPGEGEG